MVSNRAVFDSTNNPNNTYWQFNMDICGIYQFNANKNYDIRLVDINGSPLSYTSIFSGFSMCVKEFIPLYV